MPHRAIRATLPVTVAAILTVPAAAVGAAPTKAATPTCHGVTATIVGTNHSEKLVGTAGRDVILARGGDDTIVSGAGNDLICGGLGADVLIGGPGDDRLYGGWDKKTMDRYGELDGDRMRGGPGDDLLDGGLDPRLPSIRHRDFLDYRAAGNGVRIDLVRRVVTGQGRDRFIGTRWFVEGSRHDDTIIGTSKDDNIHAGPGDDTIFSGAGRDYIDGDAESAYTPVKGPGNDEIHGGPGDDMITSPLGSDRLYGDAGADEIYDSGTFGRDLISGGRGDDSLQTVVSARGEAVYGGPGRDYLFLDQARQAMRRVKLTCVSVERRETRAHCR